MRERAGGSRAIAAACAAAVALAALPGRAAAAQATTPTLVGIWCNPAVGDARTIGRTGCWAFDTFAPDGRFASCGLADGDPAPFHAEGRWRLGRDGRMCYRVTRASGNFWIKPGSRYCSAIVSIGAARHTYRDLDTGATFELTRHAGPRAPCPR